MAKTLPQIKDIDSALGLEQQAFTNLPTIAAPFTTVVNRAPVVNFAADGLPKFGVDRVNIQSIVEVQGEFGPNGERVFRPINDFFNQVRFVGAWSNGNDSIGQYVLDSTNTTDYCEITFYGTGLNILVRPTGTYSYSVNGGSETSAGNPSSFSSVLSGRNYSINTVFPIASGLTLGLNTIKIRNTNGGSGARIYGFEVLNTAATIFLPATTSYVGGRRLAQSSTGTTELTTGFESGVLGTRGGHVLVYQKADGTIAKAVTPTNASSAFLALTDHTNEEEVRRYHWREFGAGRTDDFSSATTSSSNRAFTLDDGTTTLTGNSIGVLGGGTEDLGTYASGGFWTLTFIGTGLDIVRRDSGATLDQHTVFVDGTSVGTITGTSNGNFRVQRICSGLPYGTHTVRLVRDAFVNGGIGVSQFIIYAPRTPTLPSGAVALSDYFVMADYALTSSSSILAVSQGVLQKQNTREFIYNGTWNTFVSVANQDSPQSGHGVTSNTATNFAEYTFFGTGAEFYAHVSSAASHDFTISMDGLALNAGSNVGSTVTLTIGTTTVGPGTPVLGLTLSAAGTVTGSLAASTQPAIIRISGLALGRHTIRYTRNNSLSLGVMGVGVITPVHAPKEIGPGRLQNVSLIGSSAIRDLRKFSPIQAPLAYAKNSATAQGVQSGTTTTTSTTAVPCPDLSTVIYNTSGRVMISFAAVALHSNLGGEHAYRIFVNGVQVSPLYVMNAPAASYYANMSGSVVVPVPVGNVKIDVYWATNTGTLSQTAGNLRNLVVVEI